MDQVGWGTYNYWTWKWRHDDTKTSFDFTSVDFYLFLYNETFTYTNKLRNSYFMLPLFRNFMLFHTYIIDKSSKISWIWSTVEALVSDHLGNSEKCSQLELVA